MRLRRLEIIIIAVTLAFTFFMGGFFAGRNWNTVNIISASAQNESNRTTTIELPQDNHAVNSRETPANRQTTENIPEENNQTATVNTETPAEAIGQPVINDGRININTASQSELTDLPGIGNVLASRIVDYRKAHGNFNKIEDIKNVSGIGDKRYETIQDKITVG